MIVAGVTGRDGQWFWDGMEEVLGDGSRANFWDGFWSGEKPLKDQFPRLFQLSVNKNGKVGEMGYWEEGRWSWRVGWRRDLREREKNLEEELLNFLQVYSLNVGEKDNWRRRDSTNGEFHVKDAYKEIAKFGRVSGNERRTDVPFKVWKFHAPIKAQILTWRLLKNRLPTKDNLRKRNIIGQHQEIDCSGCRAALESANHVFFECELVVNLWCRMIDWIGVRWVSPRGAEMHLISFSFLLGDRKYEKRLGGLWMCMIWVIWKWRNAVQFEGKDWEANRIEEEIKCRFWSWCLAKNDAIPGTSFNTWARNTLNVLWNVN